MGFSARQCRTALAAVGNIARRPGERRARTDERRCEVAADWLLANADTAGAEPSAGTTRERFSHFPALFYIGNP